MTQKPASRSPLCYATWAALSLLFSASLGTFQLELWEVGEVGNLRPDTDGGHILQQKFNQLWEGEKEPGRKDKGCRERLLAVPKAIPVFDTWQ